MNHDVIQKTELNIFWAQDEVWELILNKSLSFKKKKFHLLLCLNGQVQSKVPLWDRSLLDFQPCTIKQLILQECMSLPILALMIPGNASASSRRGHRKLSKTEKEVQGIHKPVRRQSWWERRPVRGEHHEGWQGENLPEGSWTQFHVLSL